jgi:hypothetical protein
MWLGGSVLHVWLESMLGHTAMAGSSGGGDEKGGRGERGEAAHMCVAKRHAPSLDYSIEDLVNMISLKTPILKEVAKLRTETLLIKLL